MYGVDEIIGRYQTTGNILNLIDDIVNRFKVECRGQTFEDFIKDFEELPPLHDEFNRKYIAQYEKSYPVKNNEQILFVNPDLQSEMLLLREHDNKQSIVLVKEHPHLADVFSASYLTEINDSISVDEVVNHYKQYIEKCNDFKNLEFYGERSINDDLKMEVSKHNAGLSVLILKKELRPNGNREIIGSRKLDLSPFVTYLRLGVLTVCGASQIREQQYIGKGYGKIMYDTVDKIIPYLQVPHGYEGTPYGLTEYSRTFWEKRKQHIVLPEVLDKYAVQNDELEKLNSEFYNTPVIRIGKQHDIRTVVSAYLLNQNGSMPISYMTDYHTNDNNIVFSEHEKNTVSLTKYKQKLSMGNDEFNPSVLNSMLEDMLLDKINSFELSDIEKIDDAISHVSSFFGLQPDTGFLEMVKNEIASNNDINNFGQSLKM